MLCSTFGCLIFCKITSNNVEIVVRSKTLTSGATIKKDYKSSDSVTIPKGNMSYAGIYETESSLDIVLEKVLDITHFRVSTITHFRVSCKC